MRVDSSSKRQRIRDVFPPIVIGRYAPGPQNSLTDVPGVLVHTESLRRPNKADEHGQTIQHAFNTGVTTILPRKEWFEYGCHAGLFAFNGSGEMTGAHWINETGLLCSPVIITGSLGVGACYDGVYRWAVREHADKHGLATGFLLPVIAETYDGYLHDVASMPVGPDMVVRGIDGASSAPVPEGNTGGGTGMMCQGFKGGTGSASRVVPASVTRDGQTSNTIYTVGAVVQANYGAQWDLHIGRVPIGKLLMDPAKRKEWEKNMHEAIGGPEPPTEAKDGSIIIIIGTDAPLHPTQLQRLAKRATVGLARVGGWGSNTSGDVFLAFSTAHKVARDPGVSWRVNANSDGAFDSLNNQSINALFEATADVVEESIYNALCMAEDCVGPLDHVAKALPLDEVKALLERHYVL